MKGIAFGAEGRIANRERFVHDQNVGVGMGADGESKPGRHAGRIHFDRLIKEIADIGEGGDGVSRDSTAERRMPSIAPPIKRIFAARQLMVEPGAKRKDRRDPPIDFTLPCVGKVMPQMICKSVVLPAPLRPMMPTLSPR